MQVLTLVRVYLAREICSILLVVLGLYLETVWQVGKTIHTVIHIPHFLDLVFVLRLLSVCKWFGHLQGFIFGDRWSSERISSSELPLPRLIVVTVVLDKYQVARGLLFNRNTKGVVLSLLKLFYSAFQLAWGLLSYKYTGEVVDRVNISSQLLLLFSFSSSIVYLLNPLVFVFTPFDTQVNKFFRLVVFIVYPSDYFFVFVLPPPPLVRCCFFACCDFFLCC